MQLIVWNSQGGTWKGRPRLKLDVLWNNWILPRLNPQQQDDIIALVVEAGWAPWVPDRRVVINNHYFLRGAAAVCQSAFCMGMEARPRSHNVNALWVPWAATLDGVNGGRRSNSRCSFVAAVLPRHLPAWEMNSFLAEGHRRPVIRLQCGVFRERWRPEVMLTILLVHLISGVERKAKTELTYLIKAMSQVIPEGTPAIIVGDLNIDLGGQPSPQIPGWQILRLGEATHQHGAELDYGLLYRPRFTDTGHVSRLARYKDALNPSDHSVLLYTIQLRS